MSNSNMKIRDSIRERYAEYARSVAENASCCDPTTTDASHGEKLYNATLIDGLHSDVVNLALGCGDPVSIANLKVGETVLDLGSGGGIDCFLAAKQVSDTGHVIGVDMTPEMLEKANTNKAKMGVTNVEFRQGHIEALPVDNNSIDVIMSNCVINLSPQKSSVFAEAIRVLKPGGRVSISDIVTEGEFDDTMRADLDKWAECVTGAIDASAYTGLMRDAGFINIQVVDKTNAEDIVVREAGMPHIFSARITAQKPV